MAMTDKSALAFFIAVAGILAAGTGGSNHLATELFNQMAGTRMTHVPYKGGGPVLNDLLCV